MQDFDRSTGLSLGPHGIQMHAGAPTNRPTQTAAQLLARVRPTGPGQRWLAGYGRILAGGLAVLGGVVLASWVAVVAGLSLPWPLYLPGVFVAAVMWVGAGLISTLARSSRRAVTAQVEREILQLAARTRGPLTVPDTARALGLSLADAEAALADMARAGHVIADVDLDTGHLQFSLATRLPPLTEELRS